MEKKFIKFSSQIDPDLFAALKKIAIEQNRKFRDVLDEALKDYIKKIDIQKLRPERMRPQVWNAFQKSLIAYDELYRKFAEN